MEEKYKNYLKHYGIPFIEKDWDSNKEKKVVVGMSGGVDSSVAALILKWLGYRVVGIFMKNWDEKDSQGLCPAQKDYEDVISVCEKINIPYYSVNFVKQYWQSVFEVFIEDYKKGHTPNPDILCNKEIKFKVFYDQAMKLGADFVATGHYCQLRAHRGEVLLSKGVDRQKDQSYFLHAVEPKVFKQVLFPIGGLEKKVVRQIARDFCLITSEKKDSTGICFIGERNFRDFLSRYIKQQRGNFKTLKGEVVGQHRGACFYTIGQRKGLGLGGPGEPWYVVAKSMKDNTVYVERGGQHPALYSDRLVASDLNWFLPQPDEGTWSCKAKIRYRQKDQGCRVTFLVDGSVEVEFEQPQRAITPYQAVVFYQGDICLGGGVIQSVGESLYHRSLCSAEREASV